MEVMEKKGGRYFMFKAAVLALSLVLCSVSVMAAVVSSLAQDFPNASLLEIQGFINIPVIGGMIATLVGGQIATKVGKKNICLIGLALCFLGGISPMFIPDLMGKTIVRVIAGFGVGLVQPLSASLIIDCFKGKEANAMMGVQSAFVGLGATIFSSSIAAIMTVDWHQSYLVYLLVLVVIALVAIFIPNSVNEIGRTSKEADAPKKAASKLPAASYFGMILQVVFSIGFGFLAVNQSLAATETGTLTAVDAATIMSIGSVAALVGGFAFGKVKDLIGMNVVFASLGMLLVGFLIIAMTSSFALWSVGEVLINVGFCWFMPYVNFLVNEGTDATNSAKATSLGFFGNSVGSFVAPYVFAAIGGIVAGSCWKSFYISAALMAISIVMVIIFNVTHKKQLAEANADLQAGPEL